MKEKNNTRMIILKFYQTKGSILYTQRYEENEVRGRLFVSSSTCLLNREDARNIYQSLTLRKGKRRRDLPMQTNDAPPELKAASTEVLSPPSGSESNYTNTRS